jgi:hypothetical protein
MDFVFATRKGGSLPVLPFHISRILASQELNDASRQQNIEPSVAVGRDESWKNVGLLENISPVPVIRSCREGGKSGHHEHQASHTKQHQTSIHATRSAPNKESRQHKNK